MLGCFAFALPHPPIAPHIIYMVLRGRTPPCAAAALAPRLLSSGPAQAKGYKPGRPIQKTIPLS